MVIIPIEENTLELIAAINGGVKPLIEKDRHTCFIYHSENAKNEIIDTNLVDVVIHGSDCKAVEVKIIVKE